MGLPPLVNATVPVGEYLPGAPLITVAVITTGVVETAGFGDNVT